MKIKQSMTIFIQTQRTRITTNIQKSLGKDSGWIIDSVIDYTISISKYDPLARNSISNY